MIRLSGLEWVLARGTPLEKSILNGIDLSIEAGEFLTVIGTNGAGKSTLLNLISGEYLPTAGKIEMDGEDVTRLFTHERSKFVGRVFQDPLVGSCGSLTVAENLALALRRGQPRGLASSLSRSLLRQLQEALSDLKLGLESRLDTPMDQLSGGQRQAVSLVMTTLSPMKILLLDEHTSALDPKTAETILQLTHRIVKEKKLTTLMVTHSLEHALHFGTRTILLHEGRVAGDFSGSARSQLRPRDLLNLYGSVE